MTVCRQAFQKSVIEFKGYCNLMDGSGLYIQPGLEKCWRNFRLGFEQGRDAKFKQESKEQPK